MESNFKAFVDQFKVSNPKKDFERSFLSIVQEIKNVISGIKEIVVSNKQATSENATFAIREFEKQNEANIEFEKNDFSEIKDLLNAIEINTSKDLVVRNQNQENRDNFITSHESQAKDAKFELDFERKQFEIAKEQLLTLKEIRDTLKPRVPEELAEQKAKPIDILGFLNNEQSNSPSPSLPDNLRSNRNAAVVVDGKSDPKIKPKSKLSSLMGGAKFGLGAAAIAGAGYFAFDTFKQLKDEVVQAKIKDIDDQVLSGMISPEQAASMKTELLTVHKKEFTETVSEGAGNIGGGLAGATIGAKVGSVLGPVGAIGGSIVGSIAGSVAGSEIGKNIGNYLNEHDIDVGKEIDQAKEKVSGYLETAKEKYNKAKEYIQTDLLPNASKKVESFITTIKEGINLDDIKKSANDKVESLKQMIEPETFSQAAKIIGQQPGKFVTNTIKETEKIDQVPVGDPKMLVNNIVNTQSTNNYIPLKATPRQEHSGSALDRYTDRLSMF